MVKGVGFSLLLILFFTLNLKANHEELSLSDSLVTDSSQQTELLQRKHVRAKAIVFTLLTGPLGGHRVYLGTRPGAPIIYAVTLGGFGILPLVDLVHLIFTKDLSKFEQNQKIIMWGGEGR
jgi:hypothetical protein